MSASPSSSSSSAMQQWVPPRRQSPPPWPRSPTSCELTLSNIGAAYDIRIDELKVSIISIARTCHAQGKTSRIAFVNMDEALRSLHRALSERKDYPDEPRAGETHGEHDARCALRRTAIFNRRVDTLHDVMLISTAIVAHIDVNKARVEQGTTMR